MQINADFLEEDLNQNNLCNLWMKKTI